MQVMQAMQVVQHRRSDVQRPSGSPSPIALACIRAATVSIGVAAALVAPVFLLPSARVTATVGAAVMAPPPAGRTMTVAARPIIEDCSDNREPGVRMARRNGGATGGVGSDLVVREL